MVDVVRQQLLATFPGHTDQVTGLNPYDTTSLLSCSLDGTVLQWDTRTGKLAV